MSITHKLLCIKMMIIPKRLIDDYSLSLELLLGKTCATTQKERKKSCFFGFWKKP